jgi:hypothetical protein
MLAAASSPPALPGQNRAAINSIIITNSDAPGLVRTFLGPMVKEAVVYGPAERAYAREQ